MVPATGSVQVLAVGGVVGLVVHDDGHVAEVVTESFRDTAGDVPVERGGDLGDEGGPRVDRGRDAHPDRDDVIDVEPGLHRELLDQVGALPYPAAAALVGAEGHGFVLDRRSVHPAGRHRDPVVVDLHADGHPADGAEPDPFAALALLALHAEDALLL
jgi:hypothetical protein